MTSLKTRIRGVLNVQNNPVHEEWTITRGEIFMVTKYNLTLVEDKYDGDWVELKDYEALEEEAEHLKQRIEELERQLEDYEEYAEQRYEAGYQTGVLSNAG